MFLWIATCTCLFLIAQCGVSEARSTKVLTEQQEQERSRIVRRVADQTQRPPSVCKDWDRPNVKTRCISPALYVHRIHRPEKHPNFKHLQQTLEGMTDNDERFIKDR
jgi:hypothetical protein